METNKLIHMLYQSTRAISKRLNQLLEPYGLYSSEWSILVALKENGPTCQITLANYLNIEPAAISKSLVKLEEKKIIERKTGSDKREKKVFLTEYAIKQYPIWEAVVDKHRQILLSNLPSEKQKELYILLQSVFTNAENYKQ
jgi:MarR family transcriptional regulator for hemolysin